MQKSKIKTELKEKINYLSNNNIDKKIEAKIKNIINKYDKDSHIKINSRIKDYESAFSKYNKKHYKNIEEIEDLLGIMIICENKKQIEQILKYLQNELNIICIQNYIKKPKMGYRSIHINVKSELGFIYEIQLKTEIMNIAQNIVHDHIYKNKMMPNILKKILSPLLFNIILLFYKKE